MVNGFDEGVFVNLRDKNGTFQRKTDAQYFSLLSEVVRENSLITYKAVVDHSEMYYQQYISVFLDLLDDREKEIIQKRFGLDNHKIRSLEDIGHDYHLSRERIRQIEQKAIRKLRQPSRGMRFIRQVLYDQQEKKTYPLEYPYFLEQLIQKELQDFKHAKNVNRNNLFSINIFLSPRFEDNQIPTYWELLEDLSLSVRAYSILKKAGINNLDSLMALSDTEMILLNGMSKKTYEEIETLRKEKAKNRADKEFRKSGYAKTTLKELHLSAESYDCLTGEGVTTPEELLQISESVLHRMSTPHEDIYEELIAVQQELKLSINKCHFWHYSPITFEELGLPIEIINAFNKAEIISVRQLLRMKLGTIKEITSNISTKNKLLLFFIIKRIKAKDSMKPINKYTLDDEHLFNNTSEILITKTDLPVMEMIRLLRKGMIFVSDYIEYYWLFNTYTFLNNEEKASSLFSEMDTFKELLNYSDPMLYIKIPRNLQEAMIKRDIYDYQCLLEKKECLPIQMKADVECIIQSIDNAYNQIK